MFVFSSWSSHVISTALLSSKFCSCSKARPNKPMLRPAQRAPHLFQVPSNPDLPMIRSTKHIRGPLPGKLTNQSCKVRKCVLGQTSLVKTRQRRVSGTVRNMESNWCHLRRGTSALRAAPSFRHSAAAQPRSATRSSAAQGSRGVAAPARTGAP